MSGTARDLAVSAVRHLLDRLGKDDLTLEELLEARGHADREVIAYAKELYHKAHEHASSPSI